MKPKEILTVKTNTEDGLNGQDEAKGDLDGQDEPEEVLMAKMKGQGGPNGPGEVQKNTKGIQMNTGRFERSQRRSYERRGGPEVTKATK